MSVVNWTNDKQTAAPRPSVARRLVYGPALIIAFGIGVSGVLAAALLLSSILEF
jgi:hypothetical protein